MMDFMSTVFVHGLELFPFVTVRELLQFWMNSRLAKNVLDHFLKIFFKVLQQQRPIKMENLLML